MDRPLKFKRVFEYDNGDITMEPWGAIDYENKSVEDFSAFKSPAHITGAYPIADIQYIGMNDRYNKEIYEGDILRVLAEDGNYNILVVEYGTARRMVSAANGSGELIKVDIPCFFFRHTKSRNKTFPIVLNHKNLHDLDMLEIIGNIFENPEML
jgi:hypothetical protein